MKTELRSWFQRAIPVALGAAAGYAYYYFVGCTTGTCPITGNPWSSTAYGALIGFLIIPWSRPGPGKKEEQSCSTDSRNT